MAIAENVVKSRMRGTIFFAGSMTWAAVKNHLLPPDHEEWDAIFGKNDDEELRSAAETESAARVHEGIVPYLLAAENPFFSSAHAGHGADGRQPAREGEHFTFAPCNEGSSLGELKVQDHVRFFTADGQHREEAIRYAVAANPEFAMERVPVIFPAVHLGRAGASVVLGPKP
ncbi:DNA sulfur modification protein DndB [Dankookia sp. P2]|uniref:DNA sulfur modification protein DndB n=1 Tax=Dankookia sp. P2 TaxID=3423955 RepID=UPI003D66F0BB